MSALDVFDNMVPGMAPAAPRRRRATPAEAAYVEAAQNVVAPSRIPDGVILTRASSVKVTAVAWLWQDWLACGKVHLLAGAPGQSKTTIALAFAATVSSGGRWPDGRRCPPGDVLIWSGEDDPGDTLAPRLMGMGADLDRIHFVEAARINGEVVPFDPARDMVGLHAAAHAIGDVRLLVVDPIVSAITGDSHKNTEVRRGMQPLVDLASSMQAAVVGITHLSKGTAGRDPTERVTGSIAFTAVVRVVLLAAKVKGDDGKDKRILVRSKSNIGPDDGGFEYHVEQTEAAAGIPTSIVTWGAAVDGTAKELLAEAEADGDGSGADDNDACELLRGELTADAWAPMELACKPLKGAGFSKKQIWSISKKLGVVRTKSGFQGVVYWRLPGGADPAMPSPSDKDSTNDSKDSSLGEKESLESLGDLESLAEARL